MRKKYFVVAVLFSFMAVLAAADLPLAPCLEKSKNILILSSYHVTYPWTERIDKALKDGCLEQPFTKSVSVSAFDMIRAYRPQGNESKFAKYLELIKAGKYDIVIAVDTPIINMLTEYGKDIPDSVAIIFCGCESVPSALKKIHPNITGVLQEEAPFRALRAGLRFYPDTKNIVILSDYSLESQKFEAMIKNSIPKISFRNINFIFKSSARESLKDIFNDIAALPKETLVLVSQWRGFRANDFWIMDDFLSTLAKSCKRPYLVSGVSCLGKNALGGVFVCPETHAREAVFLVAEAVKRGRAENIPIPDGEVTSIFDEKVFIKNGLDLSKLPANTIFINRHFSFFVRYSYFFIVFLGIIVLILFFVLIYMYIMRRNRQLGWEIFSLLPGKFYVVNEQERILFSNSTNLNSKRTKRYLKDIKKIDHEKIAFNIHKVIKTQKSQQIDYSYQDVKCAIFFVPIAEHLFGEKAVICFAYDNTALQNQREKLQMSYRELEKGVSVTKSAVFTFYPASKKISGSLLLPKLLPIKDGCLDDFSNWVYERDLGQLESKMNCLLTGKSFFVSIDFRRKDARDLRQFRMDCHAKRGADQQVIIEGVIQDISELKEEFFKLTEQSKLSDTIINFLPFFLFVKDADDSFKYVLCNQCYADFLGKSRAEIIGKKEVEVSSGFSGNKLCKVSDFTALQSSEVLSTEETVLDRDGFQRHFIVEKKGFVDSKNRHLLICAATEVTKLNRLLMSEKANSALLLAVMNKTDDLDSTFDHIADSLLKILSCNWIVLMKCNADGPLKKISGLGFYGRSLFEKRRCGKAISDME